MRVTDRNAWYVSGLNGIAESQNPERQYGGQNAPPRDHEGDSPWNAGRSLAAVAVRSSGMTLASARTGMKLVSPFQRGTT
jgi:hypothetical protein